MQQAAIDASNPGDQPFNPLGPGVTDTNDPGDGIGAGLGPGPGFPGSPGFSGSSPSGGFSLLTPVPVAVTAAVND